MGVSQPPSANQADGPAAETEGGPAGTMATGAAAGTETKDPAERPSTLRRVILIGASVLLLPALMAALAFALTMLIRMVIERQQEPDLHAPTFWVLFALCMASIAIPIIVREICGPRSSGPARGELPEGARVWLTFLQEEAGPVTRVALQLPGEAPRHTLVRAREMEPVDVQLLDGLTDPTQGLARAAGDTWELTAAAHEVLSTSDGTLQSIIDELLAQPRPRARAATLHTASEPSEPGSSEPGSTEQGVVPRPPHESPLAADLKVPHGPVRQALTRVGQWLIIALVAWVVLVLAWLMLSDFGIVPDVEDNGWATTWGAGATLIGPFVIWGWFGLLHLVTALESRSLAPRMAAKAWADFWFFGLASSLVLFLLGGLVTMAVWVTTDGYLPTLISAGVTVLFSVIAQMCLWARRAALR